MNENKKILLVGETTKVRNFAVLLANRGFTPLLASNITKASAMTREERPAGVVFVVPVYWESIGPFVEQMKTEPGLDRVPIIYLGDFIESSDQIVLKRLGVHTLTLGPVPEQEIVRFIENVLSN